ncbi:hypothetical protein HHK36_016632 [Tetracentron sinense]|uniref:Helicase C-terminal domain-containing protein n=1 Tax=Tetracentron sinense TaxID=13715 RepID=A0A834Z1N9_TETSI|nr:hypothetical protein HHK36_016632 [Tetracentron sinense]
MPFPLLPSLVYSATTTVTSIVATCFATLARSEAVAATRMEYSKALAHLTLLASLFVQVFTSIGGISLQERVRKVVLFILSLQSDVRRPFLIVSASSALSIWEAEFLRLAPSVNVVVYNGTRDVRKNIRTLEFYEEGGCIMFEVLLSPLDAIVEDLETLECIGWEVIVVDECQRPSFSTHFEQIKMLPTGLRLLLVSGQIKDSITDYLNMLSFLDPEGDGMSSDGLKNNSNDNIGELKERLARFVAFERKSDSSRFVEYWVPARLSNVQLEQYCATLLSNCMLLRSCSKNDSVGALRDIVISTKKCCDHPYLVNESLQSLLTKGLPVVEYLDVGIKASGKLQLLDKILTEIKNRGLRVVILFQSIGGSGRDSIGDILDDFLRQRFGKDSYERIDSGGIVASKKQAALNMFNNKESGRFVFLIENRACLPSIKLSSVDAVILFDSDWNPLNDIRALQKITIDSQYDQIKVFRLYSSCTVEEKVLILAKQGMTLDSNIPNISRSTSHMLLIWGASYLFNKLDEFHGTPGSGSNISSEHSLLNDVIQELLTQLPENSVNTDASNCSIILKVQQSGATYLNNISLLGEVEMPLRDDELPHVFWTKLLEERYPQWRYSSGPSQRIRRKVQYCNESLKKSEVESDEVIKKRKKVVNTTNDPNSLKPSEENKRKVVAGDKEGASGTPADKFLPRSKANMNDLNHVNRASSVSPVANYISEVCEAHMVESDERRKLHDAQKSLHLLLKPEISKLCQILQLPCWTAASLLKYKIDRKESLALAKQCLNFDCKEEEAEFIYSKLRMMKKMFSHHTENVKESISSEDPVTRTTDAVEIIFHIASKSTTSDQQELAGEIRESSQYHYCSDQQVRVKQEQASDFKMAQESDFSRSIRRVEKICTKRMKKVLQKQKEEVKEYIKMREKEKEKLEEEHKLESAIIRRLHTTHISVRLDKLKMLDHNFAKRMEEHNHQWEINRKNLEAMQLVARNEEKQMKACWLEEVKLGKPVESFGKLLLLDSRFRLKHMETSEQAGVHDGPKNAAPMSGPSSGKQNSGGIVPSVPGGVILAPDAVPSEAVECVVSMETLTLSMESNREKDGIDTMASEGATVIRAEQHNSAGNSNDGSMSAAPRLGLSADEQNPTVLSMPGEVPSEVPKTVPNVLLEGSDPRGMETLSLESNIQNDVMHSVASEKATVTGLKRHNRASSSIGGDSPSMELTWRGSPLAEPQINPAQGSPLSSHQVLPVGHSQPFISAGVQENNASSGDVQNSPQQVEVLSLQPINTVLCNPSNNDSMVVQPVLQKQLPVSTDPPFAEHDQPNAPVAEGIHHQLSNDGHTSVHQPQVPTQPLVEDLAELSNHSIPQPTTHLRLHPHIDSPVRRSETHVSDLRSTCIIPELNNRPLQMAPVTSHWHPDPLQFEMGRIHKEREQAIKTHEETKLRLKAECDKEIEEIRRKYNNLLQGAETELIQKRKSLETNYNKVYMSRILAEAFRSKCSEAREAGAPGLQQEAPSSFMHQLLQLSLQQPSMRPVSVADSQTIRLPTAPPVQVIHSSASFSTNLVGPHSSLISRPTVNVPVGSELRAPAPHLRPSRPALSMSAPNLLPLLHGMSSQQSSSNLPPTQNLPVHSELRAPAPHIRPSRPATSMSAPDFPPLPCGMSSLQSSSNPPPTQNLPVHSELRAPAAHHQPFRPAISVSAPDFPPLPCGMSSSQSSSNPPATFSMRSQLTPQLPGPCSRTHQPQNTGEFPALHNSSLSALELLKDIDHRAGVNSPNFTPPMQDLCPPFDTWVPSELAVTGSVQGTIASTGAATDIVCLSDDDGSDNDK